LFELKGYNAKHLVKEFLRKGWNVGLVYKLLQKLRITGSVDHRPSHSRWSSSRTGDNIDLVDELVLHKSGQVRNSICTMCSIIQFYCLQKIIKIGWWVLKI